MSASLIGVIDFETTGISSAGGDRATEVAIVLTERGRVVDRFQSLMNAGVPVNSFVSQLTGITNAMVRAAPPAAEVMREAARFVGTAPLVAHNAGFDQRFWRSELAHAGVAAPHPFACTVLLSRRLYPDAPAHKLGVLADWLGLPRNGRAHRALADAEVTAELLARLRHDLMHRHHLPEPDHALLQTLQRCQKAQLPRVLQSLAQRTTPAAA
ncbi:3'-5' exonuclease [Hydrogenophaga sp. R2]|uniref:3'-5' exonuclease n=1 Tax=Hydrogenophaga sp. R2 TaxID=3132827 RepID=UPI003CF19B09